MTRTVRPLTPAEVDILLGWAATEGWNPGLGDAPAFQAADPEGFLGAFVDGEMVAGISAVAYDDAFGFIGLYICHPAHRGLGHGKAVWDAAMARLGDRTIGLDGVPAQQANYRKMGFVPAYETIRMTGALGGTALATPVTDIAGIAAIDRACFPGARDAFLAEWLKPPRRVLALNGGYGAVRPCAADQKIGPLFVPDALTALALLSALTSATVSIDVPVRQTAFLAALASAGFASGFSTTRMYRGPAPSIDLSKIFGVTTLELG